MKAPFIRHPYNYDTAEAGDEASVKDFGPSPTVQSMAEDADINVVMQRFGVTGKMPENPRIPTYQDFEDVFDFRTANEAVMEANRAFMEYPASLRGRFENNPQIFMDWVAKEENREEMQKLGLLKQKPPATIKPEPMEVRVVNEPRTEIPKGA